jgi:hypothetical protein
VCAGRRWPWRGKWSGACRRWPQQMVEEERHGCSSLNQNRQDRTVASSYSVRRGRTRVVSRQLHGRSGDLRSCDFTMIRLPARFGDIGIHMPASTGAVVARLVARALCASATGGAGRRAVGHRSTTEAAGRADTRASVAGAGINRSENLRES